MVCGRRLRSLTTAIHLKVKNKATANTANSGEVWTTLSNSLIHKEGVYDNMKDAITWTIKINAGKNDIQGYAFTDTLPDGLAFKESSYRMISEDNSKTITISPSGMNNRTLSYTFPNVEDKNTYNLTFTTTAPVSNGSVKNTAFMKHNSNSVSYNSDGTVNIVKRGTTLDKQFSNVGTLNGSVVYNWTTNVGLPAGAFGSVTYKDTIQDATDADGNLKPNTHYGLAKDLDGAIKNSLKYTMLENDTAKTLSITELQEKSILVTIKYFDANNKLIDNYVFTDTASAGLTIDLNSVHVYVGYNTEIQGYTKELSGQVLKITFTDLKTATDAKTAKGAEINSDSKIVVKYNATLNGSAVIGLPGNPNEVDLTYSNNPNAGGSGNIGKTPTDKVIVFTYELDVTKIDGADSTKKLAYAEFELYKEVGETKTKYYAKVTQGKVIGWTNNEAEASKLTSDNDGLFKVIGLDDGTYNLIETKAPAGYNKLTAPVTITVTAATANGQTWTDFDAAKAFTALQIKVDTATAVGNANRGVVSASIANYKGATLPTTGGIGTTIFYIVGGIMTAGAAVLLITKKRMSDLHK